MKNKILVFIGVIIIPFLMLFIDHYVLVDDIHVNASYDQSEAWQYISEHQNEYPQSLLKLALRNKETIPFVAEYPNRNQNKSSMILNKEVREKTIPLLLQWDKRWGYEIYGDDIMGINGCGPTCLSMVVTYLQKNPKLNPYYIAQYAYKHNYYGKSGTSWKLMNEGARNLGLKVEEIPLDENRIKNCLDNNKPIICSVSEGIFTTTGHFIVLKKYENGLIYVNDPNSQEKSKKGYTFEELRYQIKNLWAYSL